MDGVKLEMMRKSRVQLKWWCRRQAAVIDRRSVAKTHVTRDRPSAALTMFDSRGVEWHNSTPCRTAHT